MAFDEKLATRIRRLLAHRKAVTERNMFGGICFMLNGKMCCGIVRNDLCVRVGPDHYEEALRQMHARPMDFTGRPLRGFVYVAPGGLRTDASLQTWLERAERYALADGGNKKRSNRRSTSKRVSRSRTANS